MTKHVTIIEDDPDVRAILARSLGNDGFTVTTLENGLDIEDVLTANPTDLVILDIGLPEVDGLTITKRIRRLSDVGIIIVSGRGDLADRVVGLEIGADDYVTKPFEPREMLARVRSVMRRGRHVGGAAAVPVQPVIAAAPAAAPVGVDLSEPHLCYTFGDWTLDTTAQSLQDKAGHPINLTSGEFKLLEAMVTRSNRVLTRDQLMDACYGNNSPAFDRSIDVCVGRLRKKLLDDPRNPVLIRTVRNGGYIFAARVTKH